MVHDGEGLALGTEAMEKGVVIHTPADEFERDCPLKGRGLLSQPHLAHPTFANFLQKPIGANEPAFGVIRRSQPKRVLPQVTAGFVGLNQRLYFLPQGPVISARLI